MSRFSGIDTGLQRLLAGDRRTRPAPAPLRVFRVVHVLTKRSDAFQMHVPDDVLNFTAFPAGTVITEDGGERYVSHPEEPIVFAEWSARRIDGRGNGAARVAHVHPRTRSDAFTE